MRHQRLAALGARRRDVDDAPPARLDHVGHDGLAAVERAREVDGEHPVPSVGVDREERIEALEPGVVHEDRRVTDSTAHLLDTGIDLRPVGDVDGHADGGATGGRDLGRRLLSRAAVPVEDGDSGALESQPLADGQADARATTGDDRGSP